MPRSTGARWGRCRRRPARRARCWLPQAVAEFRLLRPQQPILVVEGLYDDLLAGLRCGDVDLILGALRDPAPIGDVVQTALFNDKLAMLARPGHPLVGAGTLTAQELVGQNWVVPRQGTPSRAQFDAFFRRAAGRRAAERDRGWLDPVHA
ncbi:LysR substrate-binding domain-containing protein [Alloyangia mangrovi]|uniref:LysR substrate-binding domain-containing protein n=1 Tax=Alloyangia mangrovi TaxID=1779329 RepID=UPI0021A7670D|nr:LysR substrate-binding domain-containing protein [Alloyangia mangrovi]